jgi:phage shock protein PspC (stress-responsive transcriptional regulator)
VDLAPPPPDTDPIRGGEPHADRSADGYNDRILAGVAGYIAAHLGVDPLWVRIGFVVLTLAGGVGAVAYFGLWLVLIVGQRSDRTWPRFVGGAILLAGLPLLVGAEGVDMIPTPMALVLLLVGLALALWQPGAVAVAPTRHPDHSSKRTVAPPEAPASSAEPALVTEHPPPTPRPPREPSLLGRTTFGIALAVAAIGALIDQANGGRMHPEQWLGIAAVVCGLGLLVGVLLGRARWLIIPAVLFAALGYVGGVAGRLGIDAADLAGERTITLGDGFSTRPRAEELVFGSLDVDIFGVPDEPVPVDARVAFGDISVSASDDVTVEIRAEVDEGSVWLDGVKQDRDDFVLTIGPGDEADVVVDARVGVGGIHVWHYPPPDIEPAFIEPPFIERPFIEIPRLPTDLGAFTHVGELVMATDDGWFVLGDGSAIIDPGDRVVVGESFNRDNVVVIATSFGEFQLLPRGLLITPDGEVLDLPAIRAELAPTPSTTLAPTSIPITGG